MARSVVTTGKLGKIALDLGIDGLDEIKAKIAEKVQQMGGQEAKKIFMQAGLLVVREIRADIHHSITGRLSDAIFASYGREDKPNVVVGVNIGPRGRAPYGWNVEFGHEIRHGGSGRAGTGTVSGRVPPYPYFQPGVKAASPAAGAVIVQGMAELAQK